MMAKEKKKQPLVHCALSRRLFLFTLVGEQDWYSQWSKQAWYLM